MARGDRSRGIQRVRLADADDKIFPKRQWNALRGRYGLTPRQLEVCQYVCRAYENKQIAAALEITQDTVRMHLKDIFRKVGVGNRVKLVVELVRAMRE
jgi:DNA-binding CsgD family transcriptional regulator